MIKKFIDKLLGKTPESIAAAAEAKVAKAAARAPKAAKPSDGIAAAAPADKKSAPKSPLGKRVEVPVAEHGIDPSLVDDRAVKVVRTLQDGGYEAYIVGGAVRDLLVGHRPKDFDVATNATPEQVKGLFRRAFIIGRRFRIVHVVHGRGREHEVIEVSTFRAFLDSAAADQVAGNEKTSKSDLAGKSHVVDAAGRVLRDNVWGPQIEDAARRDFTVNAMYYDPQTQIVVDYHGGIKDAKKKVLRMIGDPESRYREDPVRIIRVVRFAAKLGFDIEAKTREPIRRMAALLENVPQSRMFDEMIKLLQTGHALKSLEELRKQALHKGVFPIIDVVLDEAHAHDGREKFVQLAFADTDKRVTEGRSVAPSFLLACMLWHDVLDRWNKLRNDGEPAFPALQQAIESVFDSRIGDISGRGKLAGDMREIWMMQPRFERRIGTAPFTLVEQARYRAGFDFLRLRGDAGEIDSTLPDWWEDFALGTAQERDALVAAVRASPPPRRGPQRAAAPGGGGRAGPGARARTGGASDADVGVNASGGAGPLDMPNDGIHDADGDADDDSHDDSHDDGGGEYAGAEAGFGGTAPAKKRRRRRRKPSGSRAGDAPAPVTGGGSEGSGGA